MMNAAEREAIRDRCDEPCNERICGDLLCDACTQRDIWIRGDVRKLLDETDRLHSWAGLMSLLDEHYPADVFTGESGDPGPTIIRLMREVSSLKQWRARASQAEQEVNVLRARQLPD